jgi:prepilin-type N-terminal cleavage/methylation domain-containing protein
MRRKGFTLVELLVVIAIIALLMGILMPALARVRQLAFRMTCGSNLSGIGKAMLLYANDYDDELPRAAGINSYWGALPTGGWYATDRRAAYGITSSDGMTGGKATISSCFYLLVKYTEVTPKQFLCKSDSGAQEFTLSAAANAASGVTITELTQLWDFATLGATDCSYTFHAPWGSFALTTSSEPGMAVSSDRNPYIASPGFGAITFNNPTDTTVVFAGKNNITKCELYGNSQVHQGDGQNVMFLDNHVTFEKRPFCSLEQDNIFTLSLITDKGDAMGSCTSIVNTTRAGGPAIQNRKDSLLLHDPASFASSGTTR